MKQLKLTVEELGQRIAPDVHGTGGYDGQPGKKWCDALCGQAVASAHSEIIPIVLSHRSTS